MPTLVLLNDGVPGAQATELLEKRLPDDWEVASLMLDGGRVHQMAELIEVIPEQATHLALSAGSHDAFASAQLWGSKTPNLAAALYTLDFLVERFAQQYASLLERLEARRLPITVCTLYDPRFGDDTRQRSARAMLSLLNDAIVSTAVERSCNVLDLRPLSREDDALADETRLSESARIRLAEGLARLVSAPETATSALLPA